MIAKLSREITVAAVSRTQKSYYLPGILNMNSEDIAMKPKSRNFTDRMFANSDSRDTS